MRLLPLHLLRHRPLTLLAGGMLSLASLAAPTTDVPGTLESKPDTIAPLRTVGVQPGARNGDTRTIDLLVEMQQPTAGLQFNERAGRSASREGQVRTAQPASSLTPVQMSVPTSVQTPVKTPAQRPQVEAPATPPSGLFGSGATPVVQARTQSVVERSSSSDAMSARASGRSSSDVPPEVKRWLQWPRDLIDYVRENRGFVVGITAMLLLMAWTGSMMFSRRRG